MVNETITADFFRDLVKSDDMFKENKIIFEEQSSRNIKIDKILKNASKKGNGKGYPDGILQYKENPNLIIVLEYKGDIKLHKSTNKTDYGKYAIDGALLYSSFLSKEYDVLSIAISGESKKNLKISHFLQLKNTNEAHPIFKDDIFLTLEDYLNGYKTDERKFNQDFQKLLKYSKTLNDKLHLIKVPESDRSLLISGALIALSDKAFCKSYKYQKPKELAENLINTIKNKLLIVQTEKIDTIILSYNFIKTHTVLSKKENELRDIISEVDKKINNFIKSYKYFDTLGQFYIEFLRYANNDKGLGIVLTPPHITELFSEIANINKDSIVLDSCTGTGGFLISAMKKMIIDSGGDKKKELNIKSKQIIGIEFQHNIYSLTCSNMYIHGDGRSNIFNASCFNERIIKKVKELKPNVGFLNPPYKSSKEDIEELEFILNNISMLEKGSYCVAIIPMSCMLAKKGKRLALKEKLLKENTLEAVFSMPDELFINSDVGVITSVVVFKAKEAHPENFKTYFGYWKEDGFFKKKTSGRSDYNHNWIKVKKYWVDNFRNKDEIEGHSIKKVVNENDEWCAEAFMKTDYSKINRELFKKEILRYSTHLFCSKKKLKVSNESITKEKHELNITNFNEFLLEDLFNIVKGREQAGNTEFGTIPLISATRDNNGITGYVDEANKVFNRNSITVASNGASTGEAFYQNDDFCATGDVNILTGKFDLDVYTSMFIMSLIRLDKYRFNYGRKWGKARMEKSIIKLPVDNSGEPDWDFMKKFIKSLPYSNVLK